MPGTREHGGATFGCSLSYFSRRVFQRRPAYKYALGLIVFLCSQCLWCSITLSYYRQLLDPSSVQTRQPRNQAQSQSYALQPQPPYQNHPDYQQQSYGGGDYAGVGSQGYVPPYPGPPANSPWAPKNGDGDAKELDGRDMTYEAQERAWAQAQANGPTADVGNLGARSQIGVPASHGQDRGRNEEEEDAWRLAAENGPTAHLTGDTIRQGGMRV
jgi:hypothetical protein